MPIHKPLISEAIAPIISGKWGINGFEYKQLEGTMFFIGKRGFSLTAKHVVQSINKEELAVAFVENNTWTAVKIDEIEEHPSEDVALLKLSRKPLTSWLVISNQSEYQSCDYDGWGYPAQVARMAREEEEEHALERPELIYVRGYVRRRISRSLPISLYQGVSFYELSEVAGECCSGSPIIKRQSVGQSSWEVFGIYIGENTGSLKVGYATRSDAFFEWKPRLLNLSIYEESHDI